MKNHTLCMVAWLDEPKDSVEGVAAVAALRLINLEFVWIPATSEISAIIKSIKWGTGQLPLGNVRSWIVYPYCRFPDAINQVLDGWRSQVIRHGG